MCIFDAVLCKRQLAVERNRLADLCGKLEHGFHPLAGFVVISEGQTAAKERLGVGIPRRVSACRAGVGGAAILESFARLFTSVNRDVVSPTADSANKTRMAAGISLLPSFDPGFSRRTLADAFEPTESLGRNWIILANLATRRK